MSLIAELKRRNVVKVAALYLVASWLLLQVTDVLSSLLSLPAVVGTTVVVVLLLGFVPVLIFSWIFELTPEGLKRESEIPPGSSMTQHTGRRINTVLLVLVLSAIGAVALDRLIPEDAATAGQAAPSTVDDSATVKESQAAQATPSIAVLPFENFSGNKEDDYFSDGLADTLLHHLAQVPGLTVIARNSSFQYKGANRDVREIGEQLGVGNILEGSVQRYGDKVRVIAQLVSAADGSHLWSQSYDYTMDNIFALHDAIADAVVQQLRLSLLPEQSADLSQGGTREPGAYDLLLRANAYAEEHLTPSVINSIDSFDNFPAVQMLRAALAIDPDYVDAMILLAGFYDNCAFQGSTSELYSDCLEKMEVLAKRAPELAPAYSAAWGIRGRYEHRSDREDLAARSLAKAIELNPNNADAYLSYAVVIMLDDPALALELMDKRDALDPEASFHRPRVIALLLLGRTDEALAVLESHLADGEHTEMELDDLASFSYELLGRPDISAKWAARLLQESPDSLYGYTNFVRLWNAVGDRQRSSQWLGAAEARWPGNELLDGFRLTLVLHADGPQAASAFLEEVIARRGDTGLTDLLMRLRLCLLQADRDCANAANDALESELQAREPGQRMLARRLQRLFAAELDDLDGVSPNSAAQALLDAVTPLPRVRLGASRESLDIEALILLQREDEATQALPETLLGESGFMRWDSYLMPLDRGHLLSRLQGNPDFENWREDYLARRDKAREAMLRMEAAGEIPATPESTE